MQSVGHSPTWRFWGTIYARLYQAGIKFNITPRPFQSCESTLAKVYHIVNKHIRLGNAVVLKLDYCSLVSMSTIDFINPSLSHPSIGTILGRDVDGAYQFLGIQYATLQDRLAESQLKTEYKSPVDARNHGYDNDSFHMLAMSMMSSLKSSKNIF